MRACLLALLLTACGSEEFEPMPPVGRPPWFMWGDQQNIVVPHTVVVTPTVTTQMANIRYGRPESWGFLFGARIVPQSWSINNEAGRVRATINLNLGLGRSTLVMPAFCEFLFEWSAPDIDLVRPKYTKQALQRPLDDSLTPPAGSNYIDRIVAENISANVEIIFSGATTPVQHLTMEITTYFAPLSHIRPEWYEGRYPGGEDSGQ